MTNKHGAYKQRLSNEREHLKSDSSWSQVSENEQAELLTNCDIQDPGDLNIGTQDELVAALHDYPISSWDDRIDAVSGRFNKVRELAAKKVTPEATTLELPRRTLQNASEVDTWIEEVKTQLTEAVSKGPVIIK